MMTEHHLPVQRTARYYTIGSLTEQTKAIWFCLHGFGQLAQYFGRKFTGLDDGETFVVVPEGLSRSYTDSSYQRVGASWMTREDRDYEISDYILYLNSLYDRVLNGLKPDETGLQITVLGFSQGAATACRWLNAQHVHADRLILWAGYLPHGLADLINPATLETTETHYVYGRQDEYLVELDDINEYLTRLQTDIPTLKITAFDGGHRVDPDVLKTLVTVTPTIP
ncbi:alpha/beta hydrolase [Spirosoma foliorum]|uniref:Phospholipase n=1 Tax=Spirosoma foliorum TaxID=2710596 RepID=A0A7G5H7U4_9BACT|nr:phospholipase [Spirosoma foliorum]QMW07186.1 phospholipase [Spirosoma foliorum]